MIVYLISARNSDVVPGFAHLAEMVAHDARDEDGQDEEKDSEVGMALDVAGEGDLAVTDAVLCVGVLVAVPDALRDGLPRLVNNTAVALAALRGPEALVVAYGMDGHGHAVLEEALEEEGIERVALAVHERPGDGPLRDHDGRSVGLDG